MAVSASEKLWIVSDSKATLPLMRTMTTWKMAVASSAIREIFSARMPWSVARLGSSAGRRCPWP